MSIFTDIETQKIKDCLNELTAWCGMKFKVFNEESSVDDQIRLTRLGEKILPIKIE